MMDEYSIDTFDYMINISLASLYKIFSSMKKPMEKSNDDSINLKLRIEEENLDEIRIPNNMSDKNEILIEKDLRSEALTLLVYWSAEFLGASFGLLLNCASNKNY